MKIIYLFFTAAIISILQFCPKGSESTASMENQNPENSLRAKFEPEDGKCLLFVGQEQAAIGGVDGFEDGYFNHFDAPGGFTMYTNFSPGLNSFGYILKGLDGVKTLDRWGDGPSNMSQQIADVDFKYSALAIGLSFVDHDKELAVGKSDYLIEELGKWIKNLGQRPVFLRIGYEFGGEWNHYSRKHYLKGYKRIKDKFDQLGVENVAFVWQSHGWGMSEEELEKWYPGDDYVDWCGYSFFSRWDEVEMIKFARKKGKPVFIAEATPTISTATVKIDGKTKETVLSNPEQAKEAWENWFVPLFNTIKNPKNNIKAVSYINCNWKANNMWINNPTFQDIDARLQTSDFISLKWKEETSKDLYIKSYPGLFDYLWNGK